MPDSGLIPLLTGSAGAVGVIAAMLMLILAGALVPGRYFRKSEERCKALEAALETEKRLSAELAGQLGNSNQMVGTLRQIAMENRHSIEAAAAAGDGKQEHPRETGLTWKDLS